MRRMNRKPPQLKGRLIVSDAPPTRHSEKTVDFSSKTGCFFAKQVDFSSPIARFMMTPKGIHLMLLCVVPVLTSCLHSCWLNADSSCKESIIAMQATRW